MKFALSFWALSLGSWRVKEKVGKIGNKICCGSGSLIPIKVNLLDKFEFVEKKQIIFYIKK